MNWIAKWLAARCEYPEKMDCGECMRICTARRRLAEETGCSEQLTDILVLGGITHPGIADRLADFMGATPRQRDSIVDKKHRGTYHPSPKPKRKAVPPKPEPEEPRTDQRVVGVVALDRLGKEIARFESAWAAAEKIGCNPKTIQTRCAGKLSGDGDEFRKYGMTFCYTNDWDSMTDREKMASIARCRKGEQNQ